MLFTYLLKEVNTHLLIVFFEIEDELIKICKECKYVCLMGDFNSRVGKLNDFIEVDDFLTNVIQCNSVENDISSFFCNIDIPTVRTVQDRTLQRITWVIN